MTREHTPDKNGERRAEPRVRTSRRRFLEATGVAGLVGGVGGFAIAQQQSTTYEFGGEVAGWQGQAPSAIEGETNPTIELEAGTEYEVVWENLDGQPHDFVIQDDEGNEVEGTETMDEQGETLSFTFTASEEMAQYICTIHPTSMVGEIQVGTQEDDTPAEGTPQQEGFVPQGPSVGASLVADGPLTGPVTLQTVPGTDDTHVIVDQLGQIYLLQDGELQDEPFMDISDRVMVLADTQGGFERPEGFDERGLIGFAFHPDFQENGRFYVRYSAAQPRGDDGVIGPRERGYPEDWDHIGVLSEFQVAGDVTGTPADAAAGANAMQAGNVTVNATAGTNETGAGNETGGNATAGAGDGADGAQFRGDPDSERVLLEVPEPQFNHNGGQVKFGPDGYLYTSLGDGGDGNDTGVGHVEDWYDENEGGNAQNPTRNLLGSILRIDVDQEGEDRRYGIPDDNPFVDTDAFDEIYAYGLRNPWRMSFNDGTLIAADVGQALFEEVDVIESGGNYGWNVREGFHCFNADNATQPRETCPTNAPDEAPYDGQPLLDPVLEYPHTYQGQSVGISITGGYVSQGGQLGGLSDQYVFGDWSASFTEPQGRIFVASMEEQEAPTPTSEEETGAMDNASVDQEAGNATGTNATAGNETAGNETAGNETEDDEEDEVPSAEQVAQVRSPSEQPWPFEEVTIEGGENQRLNRFIHAFARDANGNIYVLTTQTGRLEGDVGEVYQLVPTGEGDEIEQPEVATPTPAEEGEDAAGGENASEGGGNETVDAGNETADTGNESADDGNETA